MENAAQVAPLGKFCTKTWKPPGLAMSEALTGTVNLDELTKVEARNVLFRNTTVFAVNPAPLIVSVKPAPPATAEAGLRLLTAIGVLTVL